MESGISELLEIRGWQESTKQFPWPHVDHEVDSPKCSFSSNIFDISENTDIFIFTSKHRIIFIKL